MAAKDLVDVLDCITCGRTMCAHYSWQTGNRRGAVTYWHDRVSGQCRSCRAREVRREQRKDRPKRVRPPRGPNQTTEVLLDDYDMIRDSVSHIREAAERIGVTYSCLNRALYFARKRGDARGRPPREQLERAIDRGFPFGRENKHRPPIETEEAA